MPRNRELMLVFRNMELVEQIGSGMSRILNAYEGISGSRTTHSRGFEKERALDCGAV